MVGRDKKSKIKGRNAFSKGEMRDGQPTNMRTATAQIGMLRRKEGNHKTEDEKKARTTIILPISYSHDHRRWPAQSHSALSPTKEKGRKWSWIECPSQCRHSPLASDMGLCRNIEQIATNCLEVRTSRLLPGSEQQQRYKCGVQKQQWGRWIHQNKTRMISTSMTLGRTCSHPLALLLGITTRERIINHLLVKRERKVTTTHDKRKREKTEKYEKCTK